MTETTRRTVILGAGGAGVAAVLTACGSSEEPAAVGADTSSTAPSQAPAAVAGDSGANALAKTADIPEGAARSSRTRRS